MSASRTLGTQCSSSMLGSAVSSSAPTDFHPSSTMGSADRPLMNSHPRTPGPTLGCPHIAVGMHRAVQSAIGFSSRSSSALWMLAFLTPADVSSSFTVPSQIELPTMTSTPDTRWGRAVPRHLRVMPSRGPYVFAEELHAHRRLCRPDHRVRAVRLWIRVVRLVPGHFARHHRE